MPTRIIDRRNAKNRSAVNRQRFLRRFKKPLMRAVSSRISDRSIKDTEHGEKIIIHQKDILEPSLAHGIGGYREKTYSGNKEFKAGDKLPRPQSKNRGKNSKASNTGEGLDDFIFEISREEFLNLFFDDLELPDLVKKQLSQLNDKKRVHAGYTKIGSPSNINVLRSMRQSHARRIATKMPLKKKLKLAEEHLQQLLASHEDGNRRALELKNEIDRLKKRIKGIPFIDEVDLRYNLRQNQPELTTQAVMFCIMDVSGSMDEVKKDLAKRFFLLLYLFLTSNYEKIDVVFIRHHTTAKKVEEEEFFYSRETGGTVVSSALELMKNVIQEQYAIDDWNVYVAQASDGDNWNADSPYCRDILLNDILPYVQYYAYVEIMPRHHQSLWQAYLDVQKRFKTFAMQHINNQTEIYPVFRELFKRQKI